MKLPQIGIVVAIALTTIWIGGGLFWAIRGDVWLLPLNEVGDFFAGWFAPPAFFWLVLGFFRQGSELRNQATELALTREQIQRSAAAAEADLLERQRSQQLSGVQTFEAELPRRLAEILAKMQNIAYLASLATKEPKFASKEAEPGRFNFSRPSPERDAISFRRQLQSINELCNEAAKSNEKILVLFGKMNVVAMEQFLVELTDLFTGIASYKKDCLELDRLRWDSAVQRWPLEQLSQVATAMAPNRAHQFAL